MIYQYECEDCGVFEREAWCEDRDKVVCACGKQPKRLLSAFQFNIPAGASDGRPLAMPQNAEERATWERDGVVPAGGSRWV